MEAHLQMKYKKITYEQQQKDESTYIPYSIFKNAVEEADYA